MANENGLLFDGERNTRKPTVNLLRKKCSNSEKKKTTNGEPTAPTEGKPYLPPTSIFIFIHFETAVAAENVDIRK